MRPVFEQPPLPAATPGRCIDQRAVVGAKAGEGGQVTGPDQNIDAVDLMKG